MKQFCATVVKGSGRGKALGYPTLNLKPEDGMESLNIAEGIYAASVIIDRTFSAVLYFGRREMFGEPELSLEAHLIGVEREGSDEGRTVEIVLGKFIRPPRIFESEEELKRAIAQDIKHAKARRS